MSHVLTFIGTVALAYLVVLCGVVGLHWWRGR